MVAALNTAKYDDSALVLFSSIGSFFCSGVDLHFLTTGDRRVAARQMADALRYAWDGADCPVVLVKMKRVLVGVESKEWDETGQPPLILPIFPAHFLPKSLS